MFQSGHSCTSFALGKMGVRRHANGVAVSHLRSSGLLSPCSWPLNPRSASRARGPSPAALLTALRCPLQRQRRSVLRYGTLQSSVPKEQLIPSVRRRVSSVSTEAAPGGVFYLTSSSHRRGFGLVTLPEARSDTQGQQILPRTRAYVFLAGCSAERGASLQ